MPYATIATGSIFFCAISSAVSTMVIVEMMDDENFSYKWRKRNPIKPVWFSVLLRKKSRVKGSWLSAEMFILQLCGTQFLLRCSWLILISLWYLLKTTMTNPSYVLRIFFRNFRKLVMSLCPVNKYLNFWCHPKILLQACWLS